MKNIFIGLIAVWGLFLVSCETREPMVEVIERGLEVSKRQAVFLAKEVENQEGRLSLIHISEPTRRLSRSRMPSSA